VDNEIRALKTAITQHGLNFTNLVAGISVGSEDLYRITETGIKNGENPGVGPGKIATYIQQVRDALTGTPLAGTPVGHVDTWTAWVNGSNQAVIDACDWIGFDAYPYFQETQANAIANNKDLFEEALAKTKTAVGGKPIWITETGYPVSGQTVGMAIPSVENAKVYWDQVGCPRFGKENIWWYTFQDATPDTSKPSFGIIGGALTDVPVFNISCEGIHHS
jgi:glucan endo-1,3-beta-D-glucosidase